MAGARVFQDEFTCPVCLDLLKDPVTIQCGHSYCMSCITDCLNEEDDKRVYSCPQCRQTFSPRPALARNTMLAEVVEKLKKTKLSADCDAGAGDVQCDVCTGRKYKAVKSCLMCLNSYCQNHLEQHESWFKGKRHSVIEATGRLQEMICQKHEKLLEVFCRTDQKCICVLCTVTEHKNHDTSLPSITKQARQYQRRQNTEKNTYTKEFLHFLTLDLNTAYKHLRLSESNRVITATNTVQSYPDHPDRFQYYSPVLCRESVCGRCYWEIEWSGCVRISVSYKSISRKGRRYECVFGSRSNDQSWSLFCSPSSYSFIHNNIWTAPSVKSIIRRIGVFVDHSAGTLSFYSVFDTMSLIHTVQTTFTQPLYAGFGVGSGSSVKLC
uniref:Tripartite motif-containing protein 16-like n=1 Tax=Sinocyclocheilus grahami TaxID=75366 RepID=A0A672L9F3_SINGR